jgi:hypothetical protein
MPKAPRAPRSSQRTAAGMASRPGGADARSQAAAPAPTVGARPMAEEEKPAPTSASQSTAEIGEPSAAPRFRIFIVDSGWNSAAHRVLVENFALIRELQKEDPIYVLSREKSIEFLRRHGSRIGRDPILAVHDLEAMDKGGTSGFHGFRLHLGLLHTPHQALATLQSFARFLSTHRQSTDLEADIRADLRREGLTGAIEIIMHHEAREIGG